MLRIEIEMSCEFSLFLLQFIQSMMEDEEYGPNIIYDNMVTRGGVVNPINEPLLSNEEYTVRRGGSGARQLINLFLLTFKISADFLLRF